MTFNKKKNLLCISNLTVHYGAAQALFGVDLAVGRGPLPRRPGEVRRPKPRTKHKRKRVFDNRI